MPVTKRKKSTRKTTSLQRSLKKAKEVKKPHWSGPEVDGISVSKLNLFLMCRERFRVETIEGLSVPDRFNKAIEYGQMWHECEEAHAAGVDWKEPLKEYCKRLCQKYPLDQEQIDKWYNVCLVQFPVYVDHWKNHPDMKKRTPLLQEEWFRVPYKTPSGRTVILKGIWDSVDLVGKGRNARIWLQENKTKGDIDEEAMQHRLRFDLQSMLYLVAIGEYLKQTEYTIGELSLDKSRIAGVRYNVIRRPLSGGKGSIRQKQPTKANPAGESKEAYYQRLANDYIKAEPDYWFMRWNVEISQKEIEDFKRRFLNPILEQLCYWYDSVSSYFVKGEDPFEDGIHWMSPFGLYNPLSEGRGTDLDEYLLTGSTVGLERKGLKNV